jgi:hypothetical protein
MLAGGLMAYLSAYATEYRVPQMESWIKLA